jgi:dTDP-4-dehydrorhamnose 3,5-epimerase
MIEGVISHDLIRQNDLRGSFTKILTNFDVYEGLNLNFVECFVSKNFTGSVRGMHLQIGLSKNYRLIYVTQGEIQDALVDLRSTSSTFGQVESRLLTFERPQTILIPPGVAHGFQSLSESTMIYLTTSTYNPGLDVGVNPLSIGLKWLLPITHLSSRDKLLPDLSDWDIVV